MYSGIVQAMCPISAMTRAAGIIHYSVELPTNLLQNLQLGASVAVDGVCQTVVKLDGQHVFFDAIQETLDKTTLESLALGRLVNIERSLRYGDEIGGHQLSGHVYGEALIREISRSDAYTIMSFNCPQDWMPYLLKKGFVAIDGASITIAEISPEGSFTVHLIPETLKRTSLGFKEIGQTVNIEFDAQTYAIVHTVRDVLRRESKHLID
jgi:riboflavin synthase